MNIEIDPKVEFLVLYKKVTQRIDRIHNMTGTPRRTLYNWKEKVDQGEDILQGKQGVGRKKKNEELFPDIRQEIEENPQRVSTRATGDRFGVPKSTMGRIFNQLGAQYKTVQVKEELTQDKKDDRVIFCEDLLKNDEFIYGSFYADEMGVWLDRTHKKKMWTFEDQPIIFKADTDVKLNIWAAISARGATSLDIYEEYFEQGVYKDILNRHRMEMVNLYPKGYYYFHDAHPVHRGWDVNNWATKNGMSLNLMPAPCSDLNPIENLWSWVKRRVAMDAPENQEDLIRSLEETWQDVTPDFLYPFIDSLRNRCLMCINEGGGYINY